MSQAYFEGNKQYVPVAPHLDGLSAVGNSTKILYHLLGGVIGLGPYFLGLGSTLIASEVNPGSAVEALFTIIGVIFLLMFFVIPIVNLVMILVQGRTLPMALMKVRAVDVRTGKTATGALFLKILLEGLIAYFSLGIGFVIIAFATQEELGRTWFDRTANTMMVSTARGRDPHKMPIPAPSPYPSSTAPQAPYGQAPQENSPNTQAPFAQPTQAPFTQPTQAPFAQPTQAPFANGSPYAPSTPQTPHATPDPTNPYEQGRQI